MNIYTPLKTGQHIHSDVLAGVALNNCDLIPVTNDNGNDKGNDWQHIIDTWNKCFKLCMTEVFIGMDSDVILELNCIDELLKGLEDSEISLLNCRPAKEGKWFPHDVFAIRKKSIEENPLVFINNTVCGLCEWVKRFKKVCYPVNKLLKERR